jgi:hypothetical protein
MKKDLRVSNRVVVEIYIGIRIAGNETRRKRSLTWFRFTIEDASEIFGKGF